MHGDPIQGIDPSGEFFAGFIGGLFTSVTRFISNNKIAAAGVIAIDKASTLADAITIISTLVVGAPVPLPLLAGFFISLVPGSGIAKLTSKGFSAFGAAGKAVFRFGDVITGGAGYLDEAADVISEAIEQSYKRGWVATDKVVQFGGEVAATKVAQKLDLIPVTDFPIRNTGIDGLYRHGDNLVIVEAKGISPGRSAQLGVTKDGEQLSQDWIRRKATEFENLYRRHGDSEFLRWAQELQNHIDTGRIKVLVTSAEVGQNTQRVGEIAYEVRNWANLGTRTFHP